MLCRQYLVYGKNLGALTQDFDNCPTECGQKLKEIFNPDNIRFCDMCPKKRHRENFKRLTLVEWEKRFGSMEHLNFEDMLDVLYGVISVSEMGDDRMSAKTRVLVEAYATLKARALQNG